MFLARPQREHRIVITVAAAQERAGDGGRQPLDLQGAILQQRGADTFLEGDRSDDAAVRRGVLSRPGHRTPQQQQRGRERHQSPANFSRYPRLTAADASRRTGEGNRLYRLLKSAAAVRDAAFRRFAAAALSEFKARKGFRRMFVL